MIRNVIFDWSGTLVDDLPGVLAATNFVLAQSGVEELTLDQFRAEFCLPFTKFYDRYVPELPLPQLEAWFHTRFKQSQDEVTALPHAREFLQFCRRHKMRTFLLSTVSPGYYTTQAKVVGFGEFIDLPYAGVIDKRPKILEILKEHALDPQETVFIGDMQHDVETAKHGGVFSVGVLTGYNRLEQLRASQPDLIVEHLGELRKILERNRLEIVTPAPGPEANAPICTVGGLIFNSAKQVLMIRTQKWSGLWGIPGGKVKLGEPSVEALRREIKEETALDVEEIKFVLVQDCIHSQEFYRMAHFILLNYTCQVRDETVVKLNEEAQEFCWVSVQEAMAMKLNQPTRVLLEAVKKQDGG